MKILSLIIFSLLFSGLQANEQVSNTVSDLDALYTLSEEKYPADSAASIENQIQSLEAEIENKEKLQSLVKEIKKESVQKVSKVGGALTSLAAIKFLPKLFKKRVPDHKAVNAKAGLRGLEPKDGFTPPQATDNKAPVAGSTSRAQQIAQEVNDPNSRAARMAKDAAADAQAARERVAKVNQDRGVGNPADNNPARQQTPQDPKTPNQGQQQQQQQNANNRTRKKAGSSSAQTGAATARPAPVTAAASAQASPTGNAPEAVDSNNQAKTKKVKQSKVKALVAALGRQANKGSKAVVNISNIVVDKVARPVGKAGRTVYEKGKGVFSRKLRIQNPNPRVNKPGLFKKAKDRVKSWTTWTKKPKVDKQKKPKVEKPKGDGFFSKTGRFFRSKSVPAALIGTSVFLAYSAYGDYQEQKAIIDFAEKQYGDYLFFNSSTEQVTPAYLTGNTDNFFQGVYGRGMVKDIFLLDLELLTEKPELLGDFEEALSSALESDRARLKQLKALKASSEL